MLHLVVRGINTEVAGSSTSSIDSERVAFSNIMQEASAQAVLHMAKKEASMNRVLSSFQYSQKTSIQYDAIREQRSSTSPILPISRALG